MLTVNVGDTVVVNVGDTVVVNVDDTVVVNVGDTVAVNVGDMVVVNVGDTVGQCWCCGWRKWRSGRTSTAPTKPKLRVVSPPIHGAQSNVEVPCNTEASIESSRAPVTSQDGPVAVHECEFNSVAICEGGSSNVKHSCAGNKATGNRLF